MRENGGDVSEELQERGRIQRTYTGRKRGGASERSEDGGTAGGSVDERPSTSTLLRSIKGLASVDRGITTTIGLQRPVRMRADGGERRTLEWPIRVDHRVGLYRGGSRSMARR